MKLSNEQYESLLHILREHGYLNDHVAEDNFKHYLENKHINRFLDLIAFLKSNGIVPSHTALSTSYKLDVVIRRMLSEVLKPIELGIVAGLSNYLRFNNKNLIEDIDSSVLDDMSNFENSLLQKRVGTQNFVFQSINKIDKKQRCKGDLQKIVSKMMFGQIIAFIEILNDDVINTIFGSSKTKGQIIDLLNDIAFLRNWIAHHNMILTNNKIVNHKRTIKISSLIESLNIIADGNYLMKLSSDILRYRYNSIRKYCKLPDGTINEAKKDIYKSVFEASLNKIFGV